MTAAPGPASVDVVLPCLDEARALPWVLDRMPPGYRAIVADNGSTGGVADVPPSGRVVLVERREGGAVAVRGGHGHAGTAIACRTALKRDPGHCAATV